MAFWWLIPTFAEVTGKKMIGGLFTLPILNRVKYTAVLHQSNLMMLAIPDIANGIPRSSVLLSLR